MLIKPTWSQTVCPFKESGGFTQTQITTQLWTKKNLEWLQDFNKNTKLCTQQDMKYPISLLSFWEVIFELTKPTKKMQET